MTFEEKLHDMTMLYLSAQDLSEYSPEDIANKYHEVCKKIESRMLANGELPTQPRFL
ncbi:MAG: hypothetical protein IJ133_00920 [Clostridia bacterium]|nr:hypothetical protein [Clostridia bacterium]